MEYPDNTKRFVIKAVFFSYPMLTVRCSEMFKSALRMQNRKSLDINAQWSMEWRRFDFDMMYRPASSRTISWISISHVRHIHSPGRRGLKDC